MASSGPLYPGTVTGNTGGTGSSPTSWTNTGNIAADDGSFATSTGFAAAVGTTRDLIATNFGFAIPGGSTINGVTVEIKRRDGGPEAVRDNLVKLVKGGTISGNDKSNGSNWASSFEVKTYGGAADLWGLSLSVSDVNASNFGVALEAKDVSPKGHNQTANIDYMRITITYTAGASTNTSSMFQVF